MSTGGQLSLDYALAQVVAARATRDRLAQEGRDRLADADRDLAATVAAALAARVHVQTIADTLGVSRQRVYQLRDGTR